MGVIVPHIIFVSPSVEQPFIFSTMWVPRVWLDFIPVLVRFVLPWLFLCTATNLAFPYLLAAVPLLPLLTTVGAFVLPTMSLINYCTVLWLLYLLIPSLINSYNSKVSRRHKTSTSFAGIFVPDRISSIFFQMLLSLPLLRSDVMKIQGSMIFIDLEIALPPTHP